jgi:hypothetical protein
VETDWPISWFKYWSAQCYTKLVGKLMYVGPFAEYFADLLVNQYVDQCVDKLIDQLARHCQLQSRQHTYASKRMTLREHATTDPTVKVVC